MNKEDMGSCKDWQENEQGKNFKQTNNLFGIIRTNERMYSGDQWKGIVTNGLPIITLNYLEQLCDVKVSTLMANQLTFNRKMYDLDEAEENEKVSKAVKVFNILDKRNWERVAMESMNEQMLLDAAISGSGVSFWFWDNDIKSGNSHKVKGDFLGETVDVIDMTFDNPHELDVQKQDHIIIKTTMTVRQAKELAKKHDADESIIDTIGPNEDKGTISYDKQQSDAATSGKSKLTDVLLKMWKEDGKVMFRRSVQGGVIQEDTDTGLTRYPIALMNWKIRKKFIYGEPEITHIVKNQQGANMLASMRQLHATLMGMPKLIFNKNMLQGVSNQIGGIQGVNAQPGTEIASAMRFIQPTSMSIDVDKSINELINITRDLKGLNDNVLGSSSPDNFRAIVAQQKAAGVPLESIKRRFLKYLEDVALIWLDFYQNKYKLTMKVVDEEGEVIEFKGTDFADIDVKTGVDVGNSTQWSELLSIDALNDLLDRQVITPVQFLERFPKSIIPDQDALVEDLGGGDEAKQQRKQAIYELMAMYVETLPQEAQAQIQQLEPDKQEEYILQLVMQQGTQL